MRKMRHVVGLMVVLMTLVFSGLPANSIAFSEVQDSSTKISGLLYLQIENKAQYLEKPATVSEIDISKVVGIRTENLAMQRIYIYFYQQPSASQVQELQDLGITLYRDSWIPPVNNHLAGFLLADMPIDKLDELASKNYVVRLDTAEQVHEPRNDLAVIKTNVDDVWDMGHDGSGITIAILDSGLDTAHPDIPAPIGSWDYAENDSTIENTVTGHGTHVTGSALGRGTQSAGQYRGVAPGADLVFLKIGRDLDAKAPDPVMVGALRDAVDLLIYAADIITLSYGGWSQYHDGSSATAQAVDYAHSQGAAVFCAAGNAADDDQHYSGTVDASSSSNFIRVNVIGAGADDTALAFNLVWFDGLGVHNDLNIEYYDSGYNLLAGITISPQSESPRGTESVYSNYNFYVPAGDSTYYLRVRNNAPVAQFFHIYYDSRYNQEGAGRVTFQVPDPFYTLDAPATADNAIAVGSYTTRESWTNYRGNVYSYGETNDTITTFSARGPRVDEGVLKPNIVAPGSAVISVRDMDVYTLPGPDPGYDRRVIDNDGLNLDGSGPADYFVMQGTSMASPHAAGVAALLLQAHPGLVGNPGTLRCVLEVAAGNKGAHDNTSGYGLVDANASINPIALGLCWLRSHQNPDGSWTGDAGANVGYTSLAALTFLNYGVDESDPTVSKAMNYILSNQHADGSIWNYVSNYETSLAILPLVATHNSSYDDEIVAARNFLVDIQNNESEGLSNADWTYGGWGYGANSPSWSDLSNTQWSLMGLDAANLSETSDTWSKGELYVTRCQNLQATNSYAVTDDGGFTYQPPSVSMAWGCNGDTSQSYGAMSATGVWSLRLCGVDTSDQRVQEGLNWLRDNYAPIDTVGNPCYGDTYLYYYLLSFAKTLIMTEIPSGSWQETASQDITDYIVSQQHDDGHWSSNEGDLFATEQAILALQTRTIPTNIQRLSWLTFILHSNADMHIYDPLGRHVGMNYDTGEIEIEIPSATYSANPQNITIPVLVPGNYRIVLVGTGTGEYTLDVTGGVGDDIVAEDSFTATISEGEVHDANVNVAMITWLTIHIEEPDPVDAMVESATGTGNVSFVTDAGTIEDLAALSESDLPEENPGADFPHGLFSFNITGLSNGATVNVTINFPEDIPTTAQYWKYNTASGEWYQIPIGSNDGDHIVTITLQDGGIGDNDGATNGIISDPGGPGVNIYNITFLPPITTMDHFNLTYGRTLPIKFTARDNDTGEFIYDDTVNVTITNSTGHLIVFFTSGTGTDSVRINPIKEQYIVNFHTKNYDLNVGETYTIHVTFGEADALRGYAMTHFTLVDRKH